jgi:hypothetical protein
MGAAHEAGPRNKSMQRSMMSTGQVSGVAETGLFDIEPSATKLLLRIWRAHFFSTRDEGERWAAQRGGAEIVSLDEGFRRTMQRWSKVLKLVIRG